jgi:hypothetical protein
MLMLRAGYISRKFHHILAMSTPLARQLHCVIKSVACPMGHVLMVIRVLDLGGGPTRELCREIGD